VPSPRAEDGLSIVEVMVAALVLVGAIAGCLVALDGARSLTTTSERQEVAVHRAQQELERIKAIPFANLGLEALPQRTGGSGDARHYVSPNGLQYDWNHTTGSNPDEAIVLSTSADRITSHREWNDGRYSGMLDVFVTTVDSRLKRVTVAVKLDGQEEPRNAIVVSTLVSAAAEVTA
jgi:Tfp pilus assembly protein PilV